MAKLLLANPRRRRSVAKRKASRSRRRVSSVTTVAKRVTRRYRRNPSARKLNIMQTVQKSVLGAGGALAVDFAMSKLPIPAQFQEGILAPVAKGVVAVGLGMIVGKVGKKPALGNQLAEGVLTIAVHDMVKAQFGESLGMGEYTMGEYAMGYAGSAPQFSGDEFQKADNMINHGVFG